MIQDCLKWFSETDHRILKVLLQKCIPSVLLLLWEFFLAQFIFRV